MYLLQYSYLIPFNFRVLEKIIISSPFKIRKNYQNKIWATSKNEGNLGTQKKSFIIYLEFTKNFQFGLYNIILMY